VKALLRPAKSAFEYAELSDRRRKICKL